MADVVAQAITSESLPEYLPNRVKKKIETVREPVNASAEEIIKEIHKAEIPLDKILKTIDNTTEEEAYTLLDELNDTKPGSTDEVFNVAKKHIRADFDVEVLRKPFNENMNLKLIQRAIRYANANRKTQDVDIETAKVIAKKILIEKEKALRETRKL